MTSTTKKPARKPAAKKAAEPAPAPASEAPQEAPVAPDVEPAAEPAPSEAPQEQQESAPEPDTDPAAEPDAKPADGEEPAAGDPEQAPDVAGEPEPPVAAADVTDLATTLDPDLQALAAEALASLGDGPEEPVEAPEPPALEEPVPSSAVAEPPAPRVEDDAEAEPVSASLVDVAAERLRITQARVVIRDHKGNRVDPDSVFSGRDEFGMVRCLVRLVQHTTATVHERPVTTLLLAAGATVTEPAAATILAQLATEPPAEEPTDDEV